MHNIIYLPQSKKDLKEIKEFIIQDNKNQAIRVIENILLFTNNLSLFPLIWKEISNKLKLREIIEPTYRYKITYKYYKENIYIYSISKYKNT